MPEDREDKSNQESEGEGVGYGRPPKQTRWKKGQSGNPTGRPKSAKSLKTDLKAELAASMTVKIGGTEHTGTKQRLMLKTLTTRAAAGDTKAAEKLINTIISVLGVEDEDARSERLSPQDEKLLDQMLGYAEGANSISDKSDDQDGESSDG